MRLSPLLYLLALCITSFPSTAAEYIFTNVHVISMSSDESANAADSAQTLRDQAVIIAGDRIQAIVPMTDFDAATDIMTESTPSKPVIIDGQGRYLLPGLAEMHGHVPPLEDARYPSRYLDDTLLLYLAGGITTVRGMLGHADQLQLKEDIENGARLGPNLYLAGPSFNGNSVDSVEQVRNMVTQHHAAGWDLLKVHPGLQLAEFEAMAERANQLGIDFAGHIPEQVPLDVAMALGIRTIDHMDGYIEFVGATDRAIEDAEINTLVNLTLQHEVGVVPTQALWATLIGAADHDQLKQYDEVKYMPPEVREGWQDHLERVPRSGYYSGEHAALHQHNRQRLLAAMQAAGVEILMGTDAPQVYSVPGLGLVRELAMMEDAGMSPYEVLYSGTVAVGDYFAEYDNFGQVREGYRADLILVDENPLTQLATLGRPAGVMVRGQWLDRDTLDEKLAEIETAYQ